MIGAEVITMVLRERVGGFFTIESNLLGKTGAEIEAVLGLPPGKLAAGARVWLLSRQPRMDEFEVVGSTKFSGGAGIVHSVAEATKAVPGAWHHRRLVKVKPLTPYEDGDRFPGVRGIAAEQWRLKSGVLIDATLIQELRARDVYRGR